jgi:starch phosphorylase
MLSITLIEESSMSAFINKDQIKDRICGKLDHHFGVTPENSTQEQFYRASVMTVQELLMERRRQFVSEARKKEAKTVYYMCMEFLIGRSLRNNLFNLKIADRFEEAVGELGYSLGGLYDLEPDAGLGNGGLGRLAACFLDSAATLGYPVNGYSIRYEFGIFKQKIVDGWQTELPDLWLHGGDVWLNPRVDEAVTVRFDGQVTEDWKDGVHRIQHVNYSSVLAIPYDMMISGYHNTSVSCLR